MEMVLYEANLKKQIEKLAQLSLERAMSSLAGYCRLWTGYNQNRWLWAIPP